LLGPYFTFMYMHNNHCHRATAHLEFIKLLLLLLLIIISFLKLHFDEIWITFGGWGAGYQTDRLLYKRPKPGTTLNHLAGCLLLNALDPAVLLSSRKA
jgi:hypothetical protein